MDLELHDRVCLVSGSSSGIGAAAANRLVREGAHVVLLGRDVERLDACAQACAAPERTLVVEGDLRDADDLRRAIGEALAWRGRLDLVVHSAGIFVYKPLGETSVDELDGVFAINARAALLLVQAAAEHMEPGAAMVLVSSNLGAVGMADTAAYSSSKGAAGSSSR